MSRILLLTVLLFGSKANSQQVGVFLNFNSGSAEVKSYIAKALGTAVADTHIFVKEIDLRRSTSARKFDAVLSYGVVNSSYPCKAKIPTSISGKFSFRYMLLGYKDIWKGKNRSKLKGSSVGFVSLGPRKTMRDYVKKRLSLPDPSVRKLNKFSDLYPILALENVDLVAVEEFLVKSFSQKSGATLLQVARSAEVQTPELCVLSSGKTQWAGIKSIEISGVWEN